MRETPEEFFRDINNYILMGNDIMRLDYNNRTKLNPTPINNKVFTTKLGKNEADYQSLVEYDGYINKPDHINYERTYGSKWNTYSEVNWTPTEGEWPTIKKLINHLYGKNSVEEDQREEFYDYHTLLVKQPTVVQQARFNYSNSQGTSKSALAELEHYMFGDNYAKIRDTEFDSQFNSIWVNSLILHLDEPSFDNKKKMSRQIRDLVTTSSMNLRLMRTDYQPIDFYSKLLITTNDTDFMTFEKADRRYWIREIPPIPDEDKDPNFNRKMKEEVNHYIHFLLNREMKYKTPQDATFYLPQSITDTNGFKKLIGDNRSPIEVEIIDIFEQYFINNKEVNEVEYRFKDLKYMLIHNLDKKDVYKLENLDITIVIRDILGMVPPNKNSRPKKGASVITGSEFDKLPGKWWTASRENFDTEIDVFNI